VTHRLSPEVMTSPAIMAIFSVSRGPVFYRKPGALIIFQHGKHVHEFFQACCKAQTGSGLK